MAFTAIFFSKAFLLRTFVIKGVVKEVPAGQNRRLIFFNVFLSFANSFK